MLANKPMMISKGQIDTDRLILSIIVFIIFMAGLYGLYNRTFNNTFLQLDGLTVLIIYIGLIVFVLNEVLNELRTIDIYDDKICIKYLGIFTIGIHYSRILHFKTFTFENNHFIQIHTKSRSYLVNRTILSNSKELIEKFNEFGFKRIQYNNIDNYRKKKNKELVFQGIAGFLFVIMAVVGLLKKEELIERNDLISLHSHLERSFEIHKGKYGNYITFETTQNPEYRFYIKSPGYHLSDIEKLEKFKGFDTLDMLILQSDFETKIKQTLVPSFFDKHFNWNQINVYELKVNSSTIFTFDKYNKFLQDRPKTSPLWPIGIGLLGLVLMGRAKKAYR